MKMIMNLHTHTVRCNHASGTEREYIENAIAGGLKTLGFADHAPYPFKGDYYSAFRMRIEQMDDYVDTLLALREEYKGQIDIKIGYEAEYYPAYFEDFLSLITRRPVDYLIMGQHFLGNEIEWIRSFGATEDEALLCRHVDQQIEGLATGVFTYCAHPDSCDFVGDEAIFEKHYGRLVTFARDAGIPLEINLLGMREGRCYPQERFIGLCGRLGAPMCIGCDAHSPDVAADVATFDRAVALAEKHGVKLELTPTLRPVRPLKK